MSDDPKQPTNAEMLSALQGMWLSALQGMWRQQKDLVTGVETRLGSKIDAVADKLESGLKAAEERLTERLAR